MAALHRGSICYSHPADMGSNLGHSRFSDTSKNDAKIVKVVFLTNEFSKMWGQMGSSNWSRRIFVQDEVPLIVLNCTSNFFHCSTRTNFFMKRADHCEAVLKSWRIKKLPTAHLYWQISLKLSEAQPRESWRPLKEIFSPDSSYGSSGRARGLIFDGTQFESKVAVFFLH